MPANKAIKLVSKPIYILVKYSTPNAIASAIREGRFDWNFGFVKTNDIPLNSTKDVVREVIELSVSGPVSSRALKKLIAKEYEFADPLTVLAYGIRFPGRQLKYSLATLFRNRKDRPCFLVLTNTGLHNTQRSLEVHQGQQPASGWFGNERFLVVRKPKSR